MASTVVTARLSDEEVGSLDRLAAEMDRSRAWIVAKAINRYVAEESELLALIEEGAADIEAGRWQSQEDVEAMFGIVRGERDAA